MSSHRTNKSSPEASGEPGPGIVQNYRGRLQALGSSPGLMGKCLRTILHLITWLSANGTGIETLDVRVLHRFLNHDCACPGPRGYRKNLERARWHLHRFLGFLMETGRVRMPAEIETGARVVESFLQTLMAQGYVPESIAAYRSAVDTSSSGSTCTMSHSPRSMTMSSPVSFCTTAPVRIPTSSSGPADSRVATTADQRSGCSSST